ncbi:DsbC family protein [Piscinibacter sakaiensis]|uniref:Thiol:disulfide interchange protein n=1 Tax=Piscinibacter sakaiensis TaxID=1547922 RepID=A0A0K8P101_PISS1|nr:DsbC family protein [Piscinibacter sakaiensis]GAP36311.1 thiol:disulfide interchange protein DsbC [Piscinibacter sakaiensis]
MTRSSWRPSTRALCAAALLLAAVLPATAQEAVIRKNIAERLPDFPRIDEVAKTPIPGLYELRIGSQIFYSDEQGNYLIEGVLVETRTKTNLTEERLSRLTAIDPATLPMKDAIVWKQGNGSRKLVVFADPNCGYCKRFERDLMQVKDVTVYTFLYPILGPDSNDKSRAIWCAKDSTKAWRDWMVDGVAPPKAAGDCDASALQRNVALGRKHAVNGTPALIFEDGKRVPGVMAPAALERQLGASRSKG